MQCILCGHQAHFFATARKRGYFQCENCRSVFLDPADYVPKEEEKARYQKHNNDVNDPRYQQFVAPIVRQIRENHTPGQEGLDFGSGTGPVISRLLRDQGYRIHTWDPFFDDHPRLLDQTYHYIACCEVAEHFHNPAAEFATLHKLLKPGGKLYVMTRLYTPDIQFESWNYKNDETHVFFYHRHALEWIARHLNFSKLTLHDYQLITFTA